MHRQIENTVTGDRIIFLVSSLMGEGSVRRLEAGDEIMITPGTPHGFRNPMRCETRFLTTATPGVDLERFLRAIYALAEQGAA